METEDKPKKPIEYLNLNTPFINKKISHGEFVKGIKNRQIFIVFNIKDIDAYKLSLPKRRIIIAIIHLIGFLLLPLLIIIASITFQNWWLLIGIVIGYIASVMAHHSYSKFAILIFLFTIGGWFARGIHLQDYFTFFPLIYIISSIITDIQKEYDNIYVTESFVENARTFYENVNKVEIVNKNFDINKDLDDWIKNQ
ncbi:MAG: hypothetical protein WCL51_05640 [Bacteroidota bacterium]